MATFKDKLGREWVLDLDVHLISVIEARTEIRVDHLIANKCAGLEELFGDAFKFVRVLWIMVEEQAEKQTVTPEGFARGLGGNSLEDAANGFIQALADFFPRQQRAVLTALLARGQEIMAERTEKALEEIANASETPSEPVTTAVASSDSTPAPAG